MITRGVRIQLVLFLALTVVGVSIAGARYAGLGTALLGGTYVVRADFADAGGHLRGRRGHLPRRGGRPRRRTGADNQPASTYA